jgi:hypothetical protein
MIEGAVEYVLGFLVEDSPMSASRKFRIVREHCAEALLVSLHQTSIWWGVLLPPTSQCNSNNNSKYYDHID